MARGRTQHLSKGRRRVVVEFGPGEEENEKYEDFMRTCAGLDIPMGVEDAVKKIKTLGEVPEKQQKVHTGNPIYRIYYKWYDILRERIPGAMARSEIPGRVLKAISDLIKEYGPERTEEIFKVAVHDWDAFCAARKGLPSDPTIELVYTYREELSNAVAAGGITSVSHRVSRYGKKRGGDYDDYKK